MPDYRVEWSIDIDAATPAEAARRAWEIMKDPNSTATVFDVFDDDGEKVQIDLEEPFEPDNGVPGAP